MKNTLSGTAELCAHVGLDEEPFGIFYSDEKPADGFGPKEGAPISRELEEQGKLDYGKILSNFTCFLGSIWLARRKKKAAYISAKEYGCFGGGFYTGMYSPNLRIIPAYVSTGIPNIMHGERYMPSPEAMQTFLDKYPPRKAPAAYCIAKPLSCFTESETPELIVFFARPESMTGLYTLTTFATGDPEIVASPFGAGCGHLVAWPFYYQAQGKERAVLGSFDPSARKFLKTDELTFTVPLGLYGKMLEALPTSAFTAECWPTVKSKIARSRKAWGETGS